MKCIILAAGYATRLYPLTENFPKPLLEIGGKPLINYIIDEVNTIPEVDEIYIITNNKFYNHFNDWNNFNNVKPITVINDHTTSNDDRLGAIGDIKYVIDNKNINEDILVIAGDNLFDYKLKGLINFYKQKNTTVAVAKEIDDIELLKRFAVAKVDENDKVLSLVEKPAQPESNIGVYASYIYPKSILPMFNQYFIDGNTADAPGAFLQYIYDKKDVHLWKFTGNCYDVGTHESLKEVREIYSKE